MAMSTGKVVALIQAMGGGADPAVIEAAVQDWLDNHPEATTTVQDGSITEQKLATSIAQKLGLISSLSDEIADVKSAFKVFADDGSNFAEVTWEYGTINASTGVDASDGLTTRCRTHEQISTNCEIRVDRSVVPYGIYLYYYDENHSFVVRSSGYTTTSITPLKTYPYFRMAVLNYNSDSQNISLTDCNTNIKIVKMAGVISQIHSNIAEIEKDAAKATDHLRTLRIGVLENGHLTANGVVDDTYTNYRLSTKEVVAFPNGYKRKIIVNINDGFLFAIRCGSDARSLGTNLYWYMNNDVIDIPDAANYYAVSICRNSSDADHKTQSISTTADIGLSLLYIDDFDILDHNDEASMLFNSARLFFSSNEMNTIDKYAIIGHTSDCHGDYKRVENFLKYCDNEKVDVACVTGDIVAYEPKHQIKWFNDLILSCKSLTAVCTGNHDVYDNSMTDSDIYDFMFADVAMKIGNATGKTWYYTDIANKKLRVISVNLYQYGGTSRWYTHFTNEQLAWLVSTLASTPNDYGIIILSHAPQVSLDNAKDADHVDFFQDTRLYNNTHNAVSGGVPLYDIVDAFISRTTLSKTYTQTGEPSSISVSADFTSVDNTVEFIAHLTGHFHQDSICYVPNRANKQLMLNVTCTNAIYGGSSYPYLADIQDQGRNNMDSTQDAFNMYVIDRDNKTVKVIRIGNNVTYQMKERKYMEIPYAE